MKPVIFHPDAKEELREAAAYYEHQSAGLGKAVRSEVQKVMKLVQKLPALGLRYQETELRKIIVKRFPYTIYYRELADCIWVAAVAHQERKPGYWMSRTPD